METDWKKKYEEALSLAKSYYGKGQNEFLDTLFPELRESNEEEIRERLVEYFKGFYYKYYSWNDGNIRWEGLEVKKVIAYLEKQKTSEEAIRYVKENHSTDEVSDFQAAMNIAVAKAYDKGVKDTLEKQKDLDKMIVVSPEVWDTAIADAYENGKKDNEKQKEHKPEHFELKAGKWYICHRAFCCRADHLTVKEGERFMCEKDGVVKGFIIKEPEKYFIECSAPAPMEVEQSGRSEI